VNTAMGGNGGTLDQSTDSWPTVVESIRHYELVE
jgi:hypothetical protein